MAVVAAAVVGLVLFVKGGKSTDQARTDDSSKTTSPIEKQPPTDKPKIDLFKADTDRKPLDTKPIQKPDPKPDPKPEPKNDNRPRGNGALTADVLRKLKKATVYIRVTAPDRSKSSGSGFFESTSSMVLTNAHMVGMLRSDAPPPRQIDLVLNSGEKGETTIPGKIVAVDRSSDLAILEANVPAQLKAALVPLTVSPAKDLLETQEVFIAGFPLGEGLGKNITISKSSISSMRKAADGMLDQIQVNGGMHHGNSGGPVVDSDGNVVGVAVAGIEGTTINFAIPGEFVQSVLRGRMSGIGVGNEAVKRDGKYIVSVSVSTLDPCKKVKKITLDYWTGPPLPKSIPPSDKQPDLSPDCSARKTVEVPYKAESMSGKVEIALDELPPSGKMLFVQPVITGENGQPKWAGSLSLVPTAPVDPKPSMLATQYRPGVGTVQLKSTAKYKRIFGDREESFLGNIDALFGETILSGDANGARVQLNVKKFGTGVSKNNKAPETSAAFKKAVSKDVARLVLEMQLDKGGNIISKKNVLTRVPPESRDILDTLSDQLQASLDMVAVPLPGGMTTPGTSWKARRSMPIDGIPIPPQTHIIMDMTYTYRGVRLQDGREVAVIGLRGNLLTGGKRDPDITLRGHTTGTAVVDPTNGVIINAKATADATLTLRFRGETASVKGTLEVTLTRTPPVPGAEPPPVATKPEEPPPVVRADGAKPPPGWREFVPSSKAYSAWYPIDGKLTEGESSIVVPRVGQIRVFRAVCERRNGTMLATSQINLPPAMAKGPPRPRQDMLRDQCLKEFNGVLVEEKPINLGTMAGREYLMKTPIGLLRFRLLGTGVRIYRQIVTGTKEQVESKDTAIFLDSFTRRESTVKKDDPKPGDPPPPITATDEASAIAALEKLGARLIRNNAQPGKPVVEVHLLRSLPDGVMDLLKQLKSLQKRSLKSSPVTDEWLKHLKELKTLQKLDLENTKITDVGLKEVKELTNLVDLRLGLTKITNAGLKELKGLQNLQTLHMSFVPTITDAGLAELKGLKNLKELRVQATKVTLVGLGDLQKALPALKIVH